MTAIQDIKPGDFFLWEDGIFLKTDSTINNREGDKLMACVVVRPSFASAMSVTQNQKGATLWMRVTAEVLRVDIDAFLDDSCIYRTFKE